MPQKTEMQFEHIGNMSEAFRDWLETQGESWEEMNIEHWNVRVLLAIAQQLSVISASLKAREDRE